MGFNGFTEWLFSALLSWMQIIYNWFWSMLSSGGQNEFMPWFSDNWLKLVLLLAVIGLVVDYTIYLMRWRPYHVWLTALRRARGYVVRPFERERRKPRAGGYRRVLEGYEGERQTAAPDRRVTPHTAPTTQARPAPQRAPKPAAPQERVVRPAAEHADAPRPAARPQPAVVKAPAHAISVEPARDASIGMPQEPLLREELQPLTFGDPPEFVNSERATAPVYGRVYQRPGQAFMAMGMEGVQRSAPTPPAAEAHEGRVVTEQAADEPVRYEARRAANRRAQTEHVIEARAIETHPVSEPPAPRQIAVREAAAARKMDFDDETY